MCRSSEPLASWMAPMEELPWGPSEMQQDHCYCIVKNSCVEVKTNNPNTNEKESTSTSWAQMFDSHLSRAERETSRDSALRYDYEFCEFTMTGSLCLVELDLTVASQGTVENRQSGGKSEVM
ncbi:uncharacterized protein V6R79_009140 [Siganus canaliculatus]